jgi:hypothetical protein
MNGCFMIPEDAHTKGANCGIITTTHKNNHGLWQ